MANRSQRDELDRMFREQEAKVEQLRVEKAAKEDRRLRRKSKQNKERNDASPGTSITATSSMSRSSSLRSDEECLTVPTSESEGSSRATVKVGFLGYVHRSGITHQSKQDGTSICSEDPVEAAARVPLPLSPNSPGINTRTLSTHHLEIAERDTAPGLLTSVSSDDTANDVVSKQYDPVRSTDVVDCATPIRGTLDDKAAELQLRNGHKEAVDRILANECESKTLFISHIGQAVKSWSSETAGPELLSASRKVVEWTWRFLGILYTLTKWPIIATIVMLAVLQILALGYTWTSQTFLSNFCDNELPFLRDWVCSEWDRVQAERLEIPQESSKEPLEFLLNSDVPWALPYHMTDYETKMRKLRINVRASTLEAHDKTEFTTHFEQYLTLSQPVIDEVQNFFAHMKGTHMRATANTKSLVEELGQIDLTVAVNMSGLDSPLGSAMGWLGDRHMIYLPNGIEPFRELRVHPHVYVVERMQDHLSEISKRVDAEQLMVEYLQSRLRELANIANNLRDKAESSHRKEQTALVARGDGILQQFKDSILGQSIETYQGRERRSMLTDMKPVLEAAENYLRQKAFALSLSKEACKSTQERLEVEKRNMLINKRESPSHWLQERLKVLDIESKHMEQELDRWKYLKATITY